MSNRYHVNPQTGEARPCSANVQCRFGSAAEHFDTEKEAQAAAEKMMAEKYGSTSSLKKNANIAKTRSENINFDELEYQEGHIAPLADEDNASAVDMSIHFGDDYIDHPEYYSGFGRNKKIMSEMKEALRKAKGNPDALIKIYRALPTEHNTINHGDWVSMSKTYVESHLESNGDEEWHVVEAEVPAKTLWTEANDIVEWGYDQTQDDRPEPEPAPAEETAPETYIHPQGKMIVVNADGSLTITKDGKKASSSATLQDLRNGRGAWKRADGQTPAPVQKPEKLPVIKPSKLDTESWLRKNGWDGGQDFRSFSPFGFHKGAQVLGKYGLTLDDFTIDEYRGEALDFYEDVDGFEKSGAGEMRAMPADLRKRWNDRFKEIAEEKRKKEQDR